MEHSEAVSSRAVERYLLREMPEGETESFEQHFFECASCTEDLEAAAILAENARFVLPERVPAVSRSRWDWLKGVWRQPVFAVPAFAAALLAGVVVYQASELARLNQPHVLLAYNVKSASRGDLDRIVVPAGRANFAIAPDDVPDGSFPGYRCDLYDGGGHLRFSVDTPAPPAGSSLQVLIPRRGLQSGEYSLRIAGSRDGAAPAEIARYSFMLQLQ